jgi:hypothetical protein
MGRNQVLRMFAAALVVPAVLLAVASLVLSVVVRIAALVDTVRRPDKVLFGGRDDRGRRPGRLRLLQRDVALAVLARRARPAGSRRHQLTTRRGGAASRSASPFEDRRVTRQVVEAERGRLAAVCSRSRGVRSRS